MNELLNMWKENKAFFSEKKLCQIIGIAGDGNIETTDTSYQVRELFAAVPTEIIKRYIEDCISGFDKSGFVLQDLVNEIGKRIGFEVEHGVYRGSPKKNGLDGLWISQDSVIIVEVKTTDAYRINLETLNKYKTMLVKERPEYANKVSILIIAGRQDTGDLEAQIRGSRYAWDIRLISIDSLLKLVNLKESFNDLKTIRQINQVLLPQEYTRLDKLIELIFLSAQDVELDDQSDNEDKDTTTDTQNTLLSEKASFYDECAEKIGVKFGTLFLKRAKTLYAYGKEIGVVISVSKEYKQGDKLKYWFAYHPHFANNLSEYDKKYVLYGCGDAKNTFMIPLEFLENVKTHLWSTKRQGGNQYWHINIFKKNDGMYYLQTPVGVNEQWVCIEKYRI